MLAAHDHIPAEKTLLGADPGPTPARLRQDPCTCPEEDAAGWPPARLGPLPLHRAAALQLHVARKCLEIWAGALPAAVRASQDAVHRGPPALPKLLRRGRAPPRPRVAAVPGLAPETARRLEVHMRQKQLLWLWGLPAPPARSLALLVPRAPCLAAPLRPWVPCVAFSGCNTPFLGAHARAALDWHVLGVRLQHCWGLPALLQRSLAAWQPPAPRPSSPRPRGDVAVAPQALPFLGRGAREPLEAHITARWAQHRWGLPARVQASLRGFTPPAPSLVPPPASRNRSPGRRARSPGPASRGAAKGQLAQSKAGGPGHEPAGQPRSRTSDRKRSRSWTPDWKRSQSRTPSQKRSQSQTPSQEAPSKMPSPSLVPLRQALDNAVPRTGPRHAAGRVQFKTTGSPSHPPPSQPCSWTPECKGLSQPRSRTPELVGPSQPRVQSLESMGPSQPRARTPERTRPSQPRARTPEHTGPSQPRVQSLESMGPSQPRAQTPECTGPSQPHTWSVNNTRPQSQSPEHVLATQLCDLTLEYVAPSQPQAWTPEYMRPQSQTPEYVAPSQPCTWLPESPAPSQPHGLASEYVMPRSQTPDHPLPPQPRGLALEHTTNQLRAQTPEYTRPRSQTPNCPAPWPGDGERSRSPRPLQRSPEPPRQQPGPAPDVCWSVTTTHEALAALYWREPPGTPPPAAPGSPPAAVLGAEALARAIVQSLGERRAARDLQRRLSGPARLRVEYPVCLPCARCCPDGPCPRHPLPHGRRGPRLVVYPRLRPGPGPRLRLRLGFVLRLKRKQAAQWDLLPAPAPRPREPPPASKGQATGAAPGSPRPPATAPVPRSTGAPRGPASSAPAALPAAKPPWAGHPVPTKGHPLPKRLLASVQQVWAWARGWKPGPQPPPRGTPGSRPSPTRAPRPIRSH
ncbi:proline-rich protein 30 [Alligator mississippiensis]|uniref:proline-rich protein 30 n=1 Tax=Alligator mississippiensis TaxID=8496 RepID=UPI002877D2D5|nr:proline-rich protein 30 [Alligator mississippiensis]